MDRREIRGGNHRNDPHGFEKTGAANRMKARKRVLVCAGERVDWGQRQGVFPQELVPKVTEALRERLVGTGRVIAYCSANAGADILFGEIVLERAGELNIVLPCEIGDFVDQYVAPAGEEWVARFHALLARAARVEISCEERLLGDGTLVRFNNQILQGLARLDGDRLKVETHLVIVCNLAVPPEPGSPTDVMDQWPELERLILVDLDDMGATGAAEIGDLPDLDLLPDASPRAIRSILFADIASYTTTFRDDQGPLLWDFVAAAQERIATEAKPPILINAWGDGVHAAAETAHDLADYAAALLRGIAAVDIAMFGLSVRPRFRIALHAGPVFVGIHPLTGSGMIYGHHVNRAARIEPVAVAGQIYASRHFVALLRAEMDARACEARMTGEAYVPRFRADLVGRVELPKQFGQETVYRINDLGTRPQAPAKAKRKEAAPRLDVSLANRLTEIPRLAAIIDAFCERHDFDPSVANAVNLALDELLTNTISYGYEDDAEHRIDVALLLEGETLSVRLSDDAVAFDPSVPPSPNLEGDIDARTIGGLGVHFVHTLMDAVDYRRAGGHNELTLKKRVAPAAATD
jgi:anti-sigma regulatory factor (Ser/Thr protein kinase)/class 3 adenylate cyclase